MMPLAVLFAAALVMTLGARGVGMEQGMTSTLLRAMRLGRFFFMPHEHFVRHQMSPLDRYDLDADRFRREVRPVRYFGRVRAHASDASVPMEHTGGCGDRWLARRGRGIQSVRSRYGCTVRYDDFIHRV